MSNLREQCLSFLKPLKIYRCMMMCLLCTWTEVCNFWKGFSSITTKKPTYIVNYLQNCYLKLYVGNWGKRSSSTGLFGPVVEPTLPCWPPALWRCLGWWLCLGTGPLKRLTRAMKIYSARSIFHWVADDGCVHLHRSPWPELHSHLPRFRKRLKCLCLSSILCNENLLMSKTE